MSSKFNWKSNISMWIFYFFIDFYYYFAMPLKELQRMSEFLHASNFLEVIFWLKVYL